MIALELAVALVLVLLNGVFVAAEFALARARLTRLEPAPGTGSRGAVLAASQARQIDRYLAACQLGITLASLGLGWLGGPAFADLLEPALEGIGLGDSASLVAGTILAFAIIAVLHVVVGELAPKSIAIARPEATASRLAFGLEGFRMLFHPLVALTNGLGTRLVRLLGVEPAGDHDAATPEELLLLIAASERSGGIDPAEADMLEGVFDLHDRDAAQIMTPRPLVATLRAAVTAADALDDALATSHTRFPVLDELGTVQGVVHLADLARAARDAPDEPIGELARPPIVVPEQKPLDELLDDLRRSTNPLAIVVDEYGEFAGVLSVEDIVEEIVGEIADERDPEPDVQRRDDGTIVARGHVALADLRDHGIELEDPDATSIGGLVLNELGRPAQVGDAVERNGWRVAALTVRGPRILEVQIAPAPASHATP